MLLALQTHCDEDLAQVLGVVRELTVPVLSGQGCISGEGEMCKLGSAGGIDMDTSMYCRSLHCSAPHRSGALTWEPQNLCTEDK